MGLEDFQAIDQRITSGLGRRKTPYIKRIGQNGFALTNDGLEALQIFERTDVYRKLANSSIAKVFDYRFRGYAKDVVQAEKRAAKAAADALKPKRKPRAIKRAVVRDVETGPSWRLHEKNQVGRSRRSQVRHRG